MSAQPTIKVDITATQSLIPDQDDHRQWLVDIAWITPDGVGSLPAEVGVKVVDPFTIKEYREYERRQHPESQSKNLQLGEDTGLTEDYSTHVTFPDGEQSRSWRWDQPSSGRDEYRRQLHLLLKLDKIPQGEIRVKVNVIEDFDIKGEDQGEDEDSRSCYSIHSLLWELLEENRDIDIQVTRWITGTKTRENLPVGLSRPDKPLHILLIIARDLEWDNGTHLDPESVAYDTLYSIAKFFGRNGRLSVDVVRPGTFSELKTQLERRKHYDLVHIDVHGVVRRHEDPALDYSPELCFGHCHSTSDETRDETGLDHKETREVAELLRLHGVTVVVLSACLSSFGQGRPLSNMCRVFASFGMCAVTGMNFSVRATSAKAYYLGFYKALVISNNSFRNAAIQGRRTLHGHLSKEKKKKAKRQRQSSTRASSRAPTTTGVPSGTIESESMQQSYWHDEWPTPTTYFAMSKFDRTNSVQLMGESSDEAPLSSLTAKGDVRNRHTVFYRFVSPAKSIANHGAKLVVLLKKALLKIPPLAMFNHHVVSKLMSKEPPADETAEADPCAAFAAFQDGPGKLQLKHSVGLMVLEDELKRHKRLFIETPRAFGKGAVQRQYTQDLQDQWRVTNFADKVEIIPASKFRYIHKFLYAMARNTVLHWYVDLEVWLKGRDPPTTVLIITEIESIIDADEPKYRSAVNHMSRYIQAVEKSHPGRSYLLITSHGGVEWLDMKLDPERHDWIAASHFSTGVGFCTVNKVGYTRLPDD